MSLRAALAAVSASCGAGAALFRASVAKRGLIRTLSLVPRLLWRNARVYASEVRFDRAYGVQTRGIVEPPEGDRRFGAALPYQPVPPRRFRQIIDSLEIQHGDFTFIDLGCGKGRALVLATEFPFRRIVGVELSETLAQAARVNMAAVLSRLKQAPTVEVVASDAASYRFPPGPCVVFFFNPFLEETMKAVLENLQSSLREEPRDLFVVYMKPVLRAALNEAPFLVAVEQEEDHGIWRSVTSGG
jgi:SAM-dependent methyltransferase